MSEQAALFDLGPRLPTTRDIALLVREGGEAALTMATFGTAGERGLQLEGARGEVVVSGASLTPLRVAPVARVPERD